jgi:hypothetical protein
VSSLPVGCLSAFCAGWPFWSVSLSGFLFSLVQFMLFSGVVLVKKKEKKEKHDMKENLNV